MELNESKLISLVEKNEILYNKRHHEFKNAQKKKLVWENIGKQLGTSGEYCAKRFNNLRDKFARELKLQNAPSGSAAIFPSKWPYFNDMQFLRGYMVQRRQISNIICTTSEQLETNYDAAEIMSSNELIVVEPSNQLRVEPSNQLTVELPPVSTVEPSSSSAKKRKRKNTEMDAMVDEFQHSASAFTKLCDEMHGKDNIVLGFTKMAEGSLTRMSHEKKIRTIKKLSDVLFEAELED